MGNFINFSNHPSMYWNNKQRESAVKYGDIIDVPFPQVDPRTTKEEIGQLAQRCVENIMKYEPSAVMCQGEFSLSYAVISRLQKNGVCCLAASTERISVEELQKDGSTQKISRFEFVQFREYNTYI